MNKTPKLRQIALVLLLISAFRLVWAAPPTVPPLPPVAALPSEYPAGSLPNCALTPGDVLAVTKADVCTAGYTKRVRNVPADVRRKVFQEYGIQNPAKGDYEVDHLISLELGGSNSLKNLWPQSYKTSPWNAHVKDKLENRLHAEICSGQISLEDAQTAIQTDWIAAYKQRFETAAK